MLTFMQLADKLDALTGSTVTFRVKNQTLKALLVRAHASDQEIALDVAFETASPKQFTNMYSTLRQNVGTQVPVAVAGYQFNAMIHDTTVLPSNFDPEAYNNDILTIVFATKPRKLGSVTKHTAMIALPLPARAVASWGVRWKHPPHITLGYMPEVTAPQVEEIAWAISGACWWFDPFDIRCRGQDIFGAGKRVARVEATPRLRALRDLCVSNAHRIYPGIVDITTHPVWEPHITLGDDAKLARRIRTDGLYPVDTVVVSVKDGVEYPIALGKR